jgi:hypothetical protein
MVCRAVCPDGAAEAGAASAIPVAARLTATVATTGFLISNSLFLFR